MNQWIKIAFRNIRKNRRRSVVTILAVAVGFAAVGLFRGYTANTYDGLRQSAIRGEGLGHLTIYKAGWLENGQNEPDLSCHGSGARRLPDHRRPHGRAPARHRKASGWRDTLRDSDGRQTRPAPAA